MKILIFIFFTLISISNIQEILDNYKSLVSNYGILLAIDSSGTLSKAQIGKQSDFEINHNRLMGIGRISELFIASIILKLQEEEKLKLTDPIGDHILFDNPNIDHFVTIDALLKHASGISTYFTDEMDKFLVGSKRFISESDLIAEIDTAQFKFGTNIAYSPSDYYILTLLIEKVTDTPFELYAYQFLQSYGLTKVHPYFNENIADLCYPTKSGKYVTKNIASKQYNDIFRGFGTFYTNPESIIKFLDLLFVEKKVLGVRSLQYLLTPVGPNRNAISWELVTIGKRNFYVSQSRVLGMQSYLILDTYRNIKVVLLCNDSESTFCLEIIDRVFSEYLN